MTTYYPTTSTLLNKIHMVCPLCDNTHDVELRKRPSSVIIKDETVFYEEHYYLCENSDEDENEFEDTSMSNKNLLNARNAYRHNHGLLTSYEIIAIRESYGLSQIDLARLLGWGEATISRYESKAIQDEAYDTMLRLIRDNPLKALELLNKHISGFSNQKIIDIKEKIKIKIEDDGKEFLTRQILQGDYINFESPSELNGYTVLSIDKLEALISYLAENVLYLYKVKLMKLLWFVDALNYKLHGHSITGLVYSHESMGALPIGHKNLMNLHMLNISEEFNSHYNSMFHVYPNERINYTVLTRSDLEVIDIVINKFKDYKAQDIIDYMHEEIAYQETLPGSIIPFNLTKELRKLS